MWNWGSPVAWAVFLVGAGLAVFLLGMAADLFSKASAAFMSLGKRR